ncbi:MAG: hypothetical protein KF729_31110 [Sandaracinaceae bacterium]|nr:hypothetical protein [Sandaracinaceae bacterium]
MANQADMARRALDLYKEGSLRSAFVAVDPTQMRTVLAAFEQAGSLEEQEVVLRYQAARLREKWDGKLVDRLLELCRKAGEGVERTAGQDADEPKARAAAQQLGFIVRMHKVAHEEEASRRSGGGAPQGDKRGRR